MSNIIDESKKVDTFTPPEKRYKSSRKCIQVDDFDQDAIRRKIYSIYARKEHVTLNKLLQVLQDDGLFSGKRTTLSKLLNEMGFAYWKQDNRRYYYEQPQIIQQRHTYLPVIFLDETWANAHDGRDMAWVEDDPVTGGTLGGVRRPSGKGKRLIILGAGGEMGWIPNTTLIFQSKKNTGDYHDEMIGEHFEEWFRDKLLPNVPPNSLIVMDNASYHSRRLEDIPVKSWTKKRMIEWLDGKGTSYPPKALKSELFSILQEMRLTPQYVVDEMALAAACGPLHPQPH